MLRLFFNRKGELPWSVDAGPGTLEFTSAKVLVSAPGHSVFRPLEDGDDPLKVPCAWIQFDQATLTSNGKCLIIS